MKSSMAILILVLAAASASAQPNPGTNYEPPPCTGAVFNDVACPGQYADWIEDLYNEGITVGCGGATTARTHP